MTLRINRNIVECKSKIAGSKLSEEYPELIETLWNVNNFDTCFVIGSFPELIETLWNVNYMAFLSCGWKNVN